MTHVHGPNSNTLITLRVIEEEALAVNDTYKKDEFSVGEIER